MAELEVDTTQMQMSASACLRISGEIQAKITQIENAVATPATWQGRTRMAVIEQVEHQRPVLTQLSAALERGSNTLKTAGFGFLDQDETMAAGMGQAAAGAAAGQSGTSLNGRPLNA